MGNQTSRTNDPSAVKTNQSLKEQLKILRGGTRLDWDGDDDENKIPSIAYGSIEEMELLKQLLSCSSERVNSEESNESNTDTDDGEIVTYHSGEEVIANAAKMNPELLEFIGLWSLRFRHYNVKRARQRLVNYITWHLQYFGCFEKQRLSGPENEGLLQQMRSGFIRLMPHTDSIGRAILVVNLHRHNPALYSAVDSVKVWHYLIVQAMRRDPRTQTYGIIVVNDLSSVSLGNIIPKEILSAVSNKVPVRLSKAFIVRPPFIRLMIPNKLRPRIHNIGDDLSILWENVDHQILPVELGGEADVDCDEEWVSTDDLCNPNPSIKDESNKTQLTTDVIDVSKQIDEENISVETIETNTKLGIEQKETEKTEKTEKTKEQENQIDDVKRTDESDSDSENESNSSDEVEKCESKDCIKENRGWQHIVDTWMEKDLIVTSSLTEPYVHVTKP